MFTTFYKWFKNCTRCSTVLTLYYSLPCMIWIKIKFCLLICVLKSCNTKSQHVIGCTPGSVLLEDEFTGAPWISHRYTLNPLHTVSVYQIVVLNLDPCRHWLQTCLKNHENVVIKINCFLSNLRRFNIRIEIQIRILWYNFQIPFINWLKLTSL